MALAVDSLQITRVVDLGLRPAALPGLGLADDVVNLVGRRDALLATQTVGALAQSVVAPEDDQAQLFPRPTIAALVSVAALAVGTPPRCRAWRGFEQFGAQTLDFHGRRLAQLSPRLYVRNHVSA